jgi:hypothetical protein
MKKNSYCVFLLLLTLWTLASCKKDYPTNEVGPKLQIVFDDAIDKVTSDYKLNSTMTLKVAATGATSINITTTYTTGTARTANLGIFPVTDGIATVTIPTNRLRASADGNPVGAGTVLPTPTTPSSALTRANNTYTLLVDATDGTNTDRRIYTAVLVQ